MEWYLAVLGKYAVFSGRARRQEYWSFYLFNGLCIVVLMVMDDTKFGHPEGGYSPLVSLYALAVLIPHYAVTVRRLHDTDHSGWWLFIALIPIIGAVVLFVYMVQDSQAGENQYGPNPKGVSASNSEEHVLANSALDVLVSRKTWKKFPRELLVALATKLQYVDQTNEFVTLCERSGILRSITVQFGRDGTAMAIGSLSATLASYADAMGNARNFHEARQALELAILLNPRNVWAWSAMALVEVNLHNCGSAVSWADKVLEFRPDPESDDPWERGAAVMMTPEGQSLAARASNKPGMTDAWQGVRDQMNAIKEHCRGRI